MNFYSSRAKLQIYRIQLLIYDSDTWGAPGRTINSGGWKSENFFFYLACDTNSVRRNVTKKIVFEFSQKSISFLKLTRMRSHPRLPTWFESFLYVRAFGLWRKHSHHHSTQSVLPTLFSVPTCFVFIPAHCFTQNGICRTKRIKNTNYKNVHLFFFVWFHSWSCKYIPIITDWFLRLFVWKGIQPHGGSFWNQPVW